jgi:hypothetical protein
MQLVSCRSGRAGYSRRRGPSKHNVLNPEFCRTGKPPQFPIASSVKVPVDWHSNRCLKNRMHVSWRGHRTSGEQPFNQRLPLGIQRRPAELAARACIPVVRIPLHALFAVQVGVNGHAIGGFKLIHKRVCAGPVAFGVPPKSGKRRRQPIGRCGKRESGFKFGWSHKSNYRGRRQGLP